MKWQETETSEACLGWEPGPLVLVRNNEDFPLIVEKTDDCQGNRKCSDEYPQEKLSLYFRS